MKKNCLKKTAIFYILITCFAFAHEVKKQNILFLHSYHPSSEWTQEINKGMNSIFNNPNKYNLHIEYMDTKRYSSPAHFSNLKSIYQEKFKDLKFDIILSSDNNAFNFLKKYDNIIFKNAPVIFCGINDLKEVQIKGYKNFTGINEKTDIKINYDLIKKLHPKLKTIYNLVDSTETGKTAKKQIQEVIKTYKDKNIKFEFLNKLTMDQLINKLRFLPKDSILFHHTYFKTKDNKFLDHATLRALIKEYVDVPTYTLSKKLLGENIIGGYMTNGYSQGRKAAIMAKKILNGIKIEDLPPIYKSPNRYIFDYNQIKRFNIDEKKLPIDSIFINKKPSPFEQYFKEIAITVVIFIFMIVFIILLLLNIKKRKKAEIKIRKQLTFQQNLIDNVNTPIYYKNLKKEFIGCNKAFEDMIKVPKNEIIKKSTYDLVDVDTAKYFNEQDDMLLHTKKMQEYEASISIKEDKKDLKFYKNLFYEEGEIAGIVGAIFDITEPKLLNYELNRMLNTLDKNVIISKTDHDGKIFYASEAFCNIAGYSKNEIIGKRYTILNTGLISAETYKDLNETLRNKKIWTGELLNRDKSGNLFTLYSIITPEYDKNGEFINYTSISQDITANKQIEQAKNEIEHLNTEIGNTQKEVVFRMGAIAEVRSKETGNHVKRVAEYSKVLALQYGLPENEAEILKQASPMHDIGKVAIPDSILKKPGKLSSQEFEIMKTHTTIGYDMLKSSDRPILKTAAIVAYEHQEKWDGSGYPRGLKGNDIHIYGRITALADVFDALGSERCYKKAWDDEKIFNLFKEERGKHFEPLLVDIFFDNLDKFLEIRKTLRDI